MTRFLTLTLALLIAVTSQQMAMARGMARDASGQVILCTGDGPITVTLDAQGNPIGLVHICPDCVIAFIDQVDVPALTQPQVVHIHTLAQPDPSVAQTTVIPSAAFARGPPLFA